mmetsp:Transcript_5361/g.22711  ORF Transcript_5361/g.22711 Transcript_5361/m.22711 type:complete len:89 (+) Transcript_5361:94-360(+)
MCRQAVRLKHSRLPSAAGSEQRRRLSSGGRASSRQVRAGYAEQNEEEAGRRFFNGRVLSDEGGKGHIPRLFHARRAYDRLQVSSTLSR